MLSVGGIKVIKQYSTYWNVKPSMRLNFSLVKRGHTIKLINLKMILNLENSGVETYFYIAFSSRTTNKSLYRSKLRTACHLFCFNTILVRKTVARASLYVWVILRLQNNVLIIKQIDIVKQNASLCTHVGSFF